MELEEHETPAAELPLSIRSSFPQIQHEVPKMKLLSTGGDNGNGVNPSTTNGLPLAETEVRLPLEITKVMRKAVKYRECLKNHAASLGGHALDGCADFMPSGEEGTLEALKCAACGCHRNFHRREVEGESNSCADCQQARREKKRFSALIPTPHAPPLALPPATMLPRPHSQMMMGLSMGRSDQLSEEQEGILLSSPNTSCLRKRFRTKFSAEQKEKMWEFAEKLGWRIQKHDEQEVQQFCSDVGVKRHVLKVWMHNNKHTLSKKTL